MAAPALSMAPQVVPVITKASPDSRPFADRVFVNIIERYFQYKKQAMRPPISSLYKGPRSSARNNRKPLPNIVDFQIAVCQVARRCLACPSLDTFGTCSMGTYRFAVRVAFSLPCGRASRQRRHPRSWLKVCMKRTGLRSPANNTRKYAVGCKGSQNGRAKLSEADIAQILQSYSLGVVQKKLAEQFDVHQGTISKIVRGETSWATVKTKRGSGLIAEIKKQSLAATRRFWKARGSRTVAVLCVARAEGDRTLTNMVECKIDRAWFDTLSDTRWFISARGEVCALDAAGFLIRAVSRIRGSLYQKPVCVSGERTDLRRLNWVYTEYAPMGQAYAWNTSLYDDVPMFTLGQASDAVCVLEMARQDGYKIEWDEM